MNKALLDRRQQQSILPPALTHLTSRGLDLAMLQHCALKILQALPAKVQDSVKTGFVVSRCCLRQYTDLHETYRDTVLS